MRRLKIDLTIVVIFRLTSNLGNISAYLTFRGGLPISFISWLVAGAEGERLLDTIDEGTAKGVGISVRVLEIEAAFENVDIKRFASVDDVKTAKTEDEVFGTR
ncbi:hypothetical protein TNIN_196621 [Trichonephila inaurata madagascariensis]|uniref:Uncharacterized protein n=1 Tax=Trichonephila inaurata madagascariensis TaxID=2747483 RepID=A0A8X6II12_9ARAC|nr:hypothetical protein TNIN_196621 [Trichonephila inaurata madagascariensis]